MILVEAQLEKSYKGLLKTLLENTRYLVGIQVFSYRNIFTVLGETIFNDSIPYLENVYNTTCINNLYTLLKSHCG